MAFYALTSLVGSPGVSTLAAAWARHSPRPTLIVEADVTGGSTLLTGIFKGEIDHTTGLTALASIGHEAYIDAIWEQSIKLPEEQDRWLLPGIGRGTHASAARAVWSPLAAALNQLSREGGLDVIVDAGRLGTAHSPWPLIDEADAVLLVVDASLRALTSLSVALPPLRADLDLSGSHRRLGIVARTNGSPSTRAWDFVANRVDNDPGVRPYRAAEIAASTDPTPVVATVPYQPREASIYLDGPRSSTPPQRRAGGAYASAVRNLITATERHDQAYRALLDTQESR